VQTDGRSGTCGVGPSIVLPRKPSDYMFWRWKGPMHAAHHAFTTRKQAGFMLQLRFLRFARDFCRVSVALERRVHITPSATDTRTLSCHDDRHARLRTSLSCVGRSGHAWPPARNLFPLIVKNKLKKGEKIKCAQKTGRNKREIETVLY
jgi:hypothetical protein